MKAILLNLLSIAIAYFIWWLFRNVKITSGFDRFGLKYKIFFNKKAISFNMAFLRIFSKGIKLNHCNRYLYFELRKQIRDLEEIGYFGCQILDVFNINSHEYSFVLNITCHRETKHLISFKGKKDELLNEAKKLRWITYFCKCGGFYKYPNYNWTKQEFIKKDISTNCNECPKCDKTF